MTALHGWANFYVIVGSAAGALIGLQFVVMTLIASLGIRGASAGLADTFSTPTVVHFAVVLLLSAATSAPWSGIGALAVVWALMGLAGGTYIVLIYQRISSHSAKADTYQPVLEDWLFHVLTPLTAYGLLIVGACAALSHVRESLFGVGAAALLLLFAGIHNAWDAVSYHVFVKQKQDEETRGD